MKNKLKTILLFIIGIIISIIINIYSVFLMTNKEIIYKDNKDLKSTSDPDYINGVYSSSSTINSKITSLSTSINSADLLYNSTTYAHATSGSYNYASIPNMNKYTIIMFYVAVGNIGQFLVCPYGDNSAQYLYDTPSDTTRIRGSAICDWSNNRIGLTYYDAKTMTYQYVKLYKAYGLLKRN